MNYETAKRIYSIIQNTCRSECLLGVKNDCAGWDCSLFRIEATLIDALGRGAHALPEPDTEEEEEDDDG